MAATATADDARASALAEFITRTNALAPRTGATVFTENTDPLDVETISTGAATLDVALGVGGLPRGRIVEIYGPEHSGKTSLALAAAAEAIRAGGSVGFIDAEHAINFDHARWLGVDTDYFVVCQPDNGEVALQQVDAMCEAGLFSLIVVDSVSSLVPKVEMEGEIGDQHVGLQARLMSQALRKLQTKASNSNTTIVFINQLREKIGVMFGNPETTSGGRALKFYSSVRLEVRSPAGARLKEGSGTAERVIGQTCRVKVVKNKVAPPFREAEYNLMYGHGIDTADALLRAALATGLWTSRPGGTIAVTATDEIVGRGRENVANLLRNDADRQNSLDRAIRDALAEHRAGRPAPDPE